MQAEATTARDWVRLPTRVLLVVWALGAVLWEPLEQVALFAGLPLAVLLLRRSPRDLQKLSACALALALWQALSPALAILAGTASAWPGSGRYGQLADTLGPAVAAMLASVEVPWVALAWTLGAGWTASTALGLYQHLTPWPFAQPWFLRTPVGRVREPFVVGGHTRYAAGGLLFHRLRFAHGAVSILGLPLALATEAGPRGRRLLALFIAFVLLAATYLAFARAALATALFLALLVFALRARGLPRLAGLCAAAVLLAAAASSPAWRERARSGVHNLFTERDLAMAAGLRLAGAHPLLGVGFGNYQEASWAQRDVTFVTGMLSIDAHDLWLTVLAETGVPGLCLTLLFHVLLFQALWRRFRAGGGWTAAAGLLAFAGFHSLSLVHYLQHHTGVVLSFSLAFGLGLAPPPRRGTRTSPAPPPARGG